MSDHPTSPGNVTIAEIAPVEIISLSARKGRAAELAEIAATTFGFALPDGPRLDAANGVCAVGTGPGAWLLVKGGADPQWADTIARTMAETAAVCAQSGAYCLFEASGPGAADLLQKGLFLDLHPDVFGEGAAATSALSHIPVTLWNTGNGLHMAVPRSYLVDFRHWVGLHGIGI